MIFLERKMDLPNYSNYGQGARRFCKVNELFDCDFFIERIHNPVQFLLAKGLRFLKLKQSGFMLVC